MANKETFNFIQEHSNEDVRKLAFLSSHYPEVDMPFALNQIAGRQIARTKLPSWADKEGIIFPPHISMEQCSSELAGRYKADVMKRWICENYCPKTDNNTVFYDFTAGFGVDFSFLAPLFDNAVYVEQQPHLCEIAKHNLPLLNLPNAKVLNADGEEITKTLSKKGSLPMGEGGGRGSAFSFLDPARRNSNGGRTYAIGDCTPNILGFIDELLQKCEVVMIKLSPMLDWHATIADINAVTKDKDVVREVHIVSVNNECKELLLVLSCKVHNPLSVICVDLPYSSFSFNTGHENTDSSDKTGKNSDKSEENEARFLFVPNASIMKAGYFKEIEVAFGIKQISLNSHLFLSNESKEDFPGRLFRILSVSSMNKKELKPALQGIEKANISTRNFPLSPEQLRKRLKLKDGGETYIFATTSAQNEHLLYICEKV